MSTPVTTHGSVRQCGACCFWTGKREVRGDFVDIYIDNENGRCTNRNAGSFFRARQYHGGTCSHWESCNGF